MRFPLSNQFHQSLLLHLCQLAHIQVPVRLDPVLVRLDRKGSDEAEDGVQLVEVRYVGTHEKAPY